MTDRSTTEPNPDALEDFYGALLDDDADSLYERAPCGYLSTTPDGTIIKVNQTFLTLTGYTRAELVGRRTFAELLTAGGRIYHETHYAPLLQMQGIAREIALDLVGATGRRVPVLVNSVLERGADGSPAVVRTAVFDATSRRSYERELMAAKERAEASEHQATVLARTLQETLMPPSLPTVDGLDIGAAYRPAGTGAEIGGDFYDVFEIAEGDWVFVIGDVCGKGVEAAVVTALARYTIRAAVVRRGGPADALRTVHQVLLRHETNRFCTAAIVRLRAADGGWTATIALGGHLPPVLVRAGLAPEAVGRTGRLLGVTPDAAVHDVELSLRSGDRLVLYTDGVTEARRDRELYGERRLFEAIGEQRGTAQQTATDLMDRAVAFQRDRPRDDIAVVAICVT